MRASGIRLALAVWLGLAFHASAFYTNIVVDGSFGDWSGVPQVAADVSGDNDVGPDLATLQVANDESNLYLRVTYHAAINPNAGPSVFLGLDNDVNLGTGFDVFGLGLVGTEAGWQNDTPFQQTNGNFNSGTISGGNAAIAPYNSETTEQEYSISLSAVFDAGGAPVFPSTTFRLLVYTDPTATNETMGPVTYTLSRRVEEVAFLQSTVTNVLVFTITNSLSTLTYRLESAPEVASTNWIFTGYQADGNDGDLFLYDPAGPDTNRFYRVIAE